MLSCLRNRSLVGRLLVLLYLLIGSGLGNALLWCEESAAYVHLEFNLAGTCQTSCPNGNPPAEPGAEPSWSKPVPASAADCLDTRVGLSHTRPPEAATTLLSAGSAAAAWPAPAFALRPAHATIPPQVRHHAHRPPPSQALIALRTIVLLH